MSVDSTELDATPPQAGIRRVEVLPNEDDLVRVASELVSAAALISISRRNAFRIALSGGSTPRPLYERLAEDQDIDWRKWHLFWGDERSVPPTDPQSNYQMVREALLDRLLTPPGLVVRMGGELPPDEAALRYEQSVRELVPSFRVDVENGMPLPFVPRFDMIVLGMGDDGHTASLFPHTQALGERERLVVANRVPQLNTTRITFTYPLINAARRILVLVSGEKKAAALHEVLSGPMDPQQWPIQAISPLKGQLIWLVDEAAFSVIEAEMA
jgi:6-phosphogluconolactonase